MTNRRRDYATELSETEAQTLAMLQARIPAGVRPEPVAAPAAAPRWRGLGYLTTAAVVVLVTAGTALAATLSRPDPPAPPTEGRVAAPYSVEELLATMDGSAATAGSPDRRALSVVVTRGSDGCRVSSVRVDATAISAPARKPPAGRLTVAAAELPRAAGELPGCARPIMEQPRLDERPASSEDLAGSWRRLAGQDDRLARTMTPFGAAAAVRQPGDAALGQAARTDGTFGSAMTKMCGALAVDCASFTWSVTAELLSDPAIPPASRVVAVRRAAATAAATAVPAARSDLIGRPGATLRVPYLAAGGAGFAGTRPTTAELTFDRNTGALLQLTWHDTQYNRTEAIVLNP
jgi:hypothetical protein